MRDKLIGTLIGMARACENKEKTVHTNEFFVKGNSGLPETECVRRNGTGSAKRKVPDRSGL